MSNKPRKPARKIETPSQFPEPSKVYEVGKKCEFWADYLRAEKEYQGFLNNGLLTEKGLAQINKELEEEEKERLERERTRKPLDLTRREGIAVRKNPPRISSSKYRGRMHSGVSNSKRGKETS